MSYVKNLDINGTSYEIKSLAVEDVRSGSALKYWTGTKEQYELITTKDSNTYYTTTDDGKMYLGDVELGSAAPFRNVGEIVQSTIPLTDAGLHLLDGSTIIGGGIYDDFVSYIAGLYTADPTASYFCSESDWQTAVSTYGVCGKFVYTAASGNDPATVRLPKYSNKIYSSSISATAPVIGNGMTVGLTNGTTNVGTAYNGNGIMIGGAGWYGKNYTDAYTGQGTEITSKLVGLTTDGTKSGIIADLSDITTSLDGYYYIVIATTAKTAIEVDIDEIATDLNGKVDKSSLVEVTPIIETYSSGTSWYRVYSDGWCEQGGQTSEGTSITVYLLKPYANTSYNVQLTCVNKTQSDQNWTCSSKSTGSFVYSNSESYAADWRACGYIS